MGETDTKTHTRAGTRLAGRYTLLERIAAGGMATVWRARDELLGRDVAVKIMHPALTSDPSFAERFRAEARSAARLGHPNIVAVYDTGQSVFEGSRELYIVMELVEGTTLRALLDRFGYLDPPTVRHVVRGVAAALDHAHAKGIVHRDVKPENVLLTPEGDVKVCDFGIAKAVGGAAAGLTQDRPIGTLAYAAPEQIAGGAVDHRADVFALGAMTYEMLTGDRPYRGDTPDAVAAARLSAPVLSPGMAPALDGAVIRATAARPQDRFERCGDFARALGDEATPAFLRTTDLLPEPAPPPPPEPAAFTDVLPFKTRLARRARRRFRIGAVLALLVALGLVVAYAVVPRSISVPDVRSDTLDGARAELARAGLRAGRVAHAYDDVVPPGEVVRTVPRAHARVSKGTHIDIVLSRGPQLFDVPDVVGKPLDQAKALMAAPGFTLQIASEDYSDSVPEGAVISVSPRLDRAKRGTAFAAVVSKGPPPVQVPNVVGMTVQDAQAALQRAGLDVTTTEQYSDAVAAGSVVSTDPAGGATAPKGSTVTMVVSKGPRPFPMPNFVGMTLQAAKAKASSLGLVVKNTYPVPGSGKPSGQVEGQNPPAGTQVTKGAAIDLYYAA